MDKQNSDSKIEINYTKIENTPFTMVQRNEQYSMLIGNTQVTEWNEDKEEVMKITDVKNLNWTTLTSIITTIVDRWEEIKELKRN